MEHPALAEWDPTRVQRDGRFYLFLGQHGTGKTSLLRYVVSFCNDFIPDWVGFSQTESGNRALAQMLPSSHIYKHAPEDDDLKIIIAKQTAEDDIAEHDSSYVPRALGVIIDDCGSRRGLLRNNELFKRILMNQRHWHIHIFVTLQYIMQLDPENYSQVDYLFQLKTSDAENVEKSFQKFYRGKMGVRVGARKLMTERDRLEHYLSYYAKPGSCVVVDKEGARYLSYLQWPSDHPVPQLGDEEYWEAAADMMGDEEEVVENVAQRMRRTYETRFRVQ